MGFPAQSTLATYPTCPSTHQHLYLEHNGLRALPPGLWTHLLLGLSTDWEPLLRSHALLAQVRCCCC